MSSAKFAAISASLLVRKGDAAPSVVMPMMAPPRPAPISHDDRPAPPELPPFASEPRQPDNADKMRRVVFSITQEDLERLCIVAIKKGATRQEIVHGALQDYFRKLAAEFPHPCACMEAGSCCSGNGMLSSNARAAHSSLPV